MKTKLEKNLIKVCQILYETNDREKTPLEQRTAYENQVKILEEKYKVKLFQLKQDYYLQKKYYLTDSTINKKGGNNTSFSNKHFQKVIVC